MDLQNPNNEVIYIEFKQDEASNPSFEAVDRLFDLEKLKSSGRLKILWVDRTYGPDVGLAMTLMASPVQLKILHGWIKGSTCLLVPFHPCGPDFELSCVSLLSFLKIREMKGLTQTKGFECPYALLAIRT
jgi:hypothetical protein